MADAIYSMVVGRANHPQNIVHKDTGLELIYCPNSKAWLKFGCVRSNRKPSSRTHIWHVEDARLYLIRVVAELKSGSIKIKVNT